MTRKEFWQIVAGLGILYLLGELHFHLIQMGTK